MDELWILQKLNNSDPSLVNVPQIGELGNFLYRLLGALKHSCLRTFYAIDELWIFQKLNDSDPSVVDVPQVGAV